MPRYTPKELYDNYRKGFSGCLWEQHVFDHLMESSKYPLFGDASKKISGSGKGKLSTPYKSVLKFDKNPYNERQTTGDCLIRGTQVLMSDGSLKNIEDIEIGEKVITHNGISEEVYELINKKPSESRINHIYIKKYNKTLSMTNDHKMLVFSDSGYEWIPARDLKEGDYLVLPKQESIIGDEQNKLTCSLGLLAPITSIKNETYTDNVYCINVLNDHSFIANGLISHNCVSHGTRNACDVSRAVEIDIEKEREDWIAKGATEAIYGYRGFSGQGMSCARAAEFVSKVGGIVVRKNYGFVDFSKYNGNLGAGWGGRGLPDKVLDLANDHQIRTASLIRTVEEARDALANGYGLAVCSNYGFSDTRDKKGFAKQSGSWGHCMAWIACDDTNGEPAFLVQNSWGKWNDGGHPQWGPIPDGSFLIHADIAQGMLSQNGSYAFSGFDGFPLQKLPSYGFDDYT